MKLYLVRHGESEANKENFIGAYLDTPLTELGRLQAKKVGERLKDTSFDIVYSSDLSRAIDTCNEITKFSKNKIIEDVRLRETNAGEWEGKRFEEVPFFNKFKEPFKRRSTGETYEEHINRVKEFIEKELSKQRGKKVLITSHGGTIIAFLKNLGFMNYGDLEKYDASNTCIYEIDLNVDKYEIVLENCTKHLEGLIDK